MTDEIFQTLGERSEKCMWNVVELKCQSRRTKAFNIPLDFRFTLFSAQRWALMLIENAISGIFFKANGIITDGKLHKSVVMMMMSMAVIIALCSFMYIRCRNEVKRRFCTHDYMLGEQKKWNKEGVEKRSRSKRKDRKRKHTKWKDDMPWLKTENGYCAVVRWVVKGEICTTFVVISS